MEGKPRFKTKKKGKYYGTATAHEIAEHRRMEVVLAKMTIEDEKKRTHREAAKMFEEFRKEAWREGERVTSSYMKVGL